MKYVVMYHWDYEYSRIVLITSDKVFAYNTAKELNRTVKEAEHYDVEEIQEDTVYDK